MSVEVHHSLVCSKVPIYSYIFPLFLYIFMTVTITYPYKIYNTNNIKYFKIKLIDITTVTT